MRRRRFAVLLTLAFGAAVFVTASVHAVGPAGGGDAGEKRSIVPAGTAKGMKSGWAFECTATSGGANTKLDCDDPFPNNEPNIVVDPANPLHMIASSNDYGSCCDEYYTTFNGGNTWSTGNMSVSNPRKTGSDPVTAFDRKHGVALHASLNYSFAPSGEACDGDVMVSQSFDGGLTWIKPNIVDDGVGCDLSQTQIFDDKEWIAVDNNPTSTHYGRAYVTWTGFLSHGGEYQASPIMESYSDDGGKSWSPGKVISGSNPAVCTFQLAGPAGECDEDQGSTIAIASDGTVYVVFSDNRNGVHDSAHPVTNSDVFITRSTNSGDNWSTPTRVDTGAGDQWFPWVDVNPRTGTVGVLYNDRGASNGPTYTAALAEGLPGSFVKTTLSTAPANPTQSRFFQAGAPGCEHCATFHGDYIGFAYGSDGHGNAVWTDQRDPSDVAGLFAQFIYFARK